MFQALWPVLIFLPFFVVLFFSLLKRRNCPECGERLPAFQSPLTKTDRQWAFGGYLCRNCGCETDSHGRAVDPDAPVRGTGRQMLLLWAALMFGGLVSGAAVFVLWFGSPTPPPAPPAPPPVAVSPVPPPD